MTIEFSAHNIRLDDGAFTMPDAGYTMDTLPWFVSARRIIEAMFPGDKTHLRLVDLGCLEGGYAVEFARLGFQVLGMDVREANIAACNYVKSKTNLPNLSFVKDDVWNIAHYGMFDVIFCCGLLYHLDKPKQFLETLSAVTTKLLIVQTHFSTGTERDDRFHLSAVSENEGLIGRWYTEFGDETLFRNRENLKWSAWDNRRSFWIQREYLLQAIQGAGFDLVLEQFDGLRPSIAESILRGEYRNDSRGTFIGIKTQKRPPASIIA